MYAGTTTGFSRYVWFLHTPSGLIYDITVLRLPAKRYCAQQPATPVIGGTGVLAAAASRAGRGKPRDKPQRHA